MARDVGGFYGLKMKKIEINPIKAAKYEVSWWKAHHYGDKRALLINLLKHNQLLYGINIIQSFILVKILFPAAQAHNRKDKTNSLKHIVCYYHKVKQYLESDMVPEKVAEAEVES